MLTSAQSTPNGPASRVARLAFVSAGAGAGQAARA
jgi:hypothetical protein